MVTSAKLCIYINGYFISVNEKRLLLKILYKPLKTQYVDSNYNNEFDQQSNQKPLLLNAVPNDNYINKDCF